MRFGNLAPGWMVVEDAGGGDWACIPDVWRVVQTNGKWAEGTLVFVGGGAASRRPNVPMDPGAKYNHANKLIMDSDVLGTLSEWPLVAK